MFVLFVIYGVLMVGLFEESGCWFGLCFFVCKLGGVVILVVYVFGYVGIEVWLVGVVL